MFMTEQVVCLPVSGLHVLLRQLSGAEDILLLEATVLDTRLALDVVRRIARSAESSSTDAPSVATASLAQSLDGSAISWDTLSVADLDALLLLMRRAVLGDRIRADTRCPAHNCQARIEVEFQVSDYLAHHTPHRPRFVEPAAEPGWFQMRDTSIVFRLPTGADQMSAASHPDAEQELIRRCVRPETISRRQLRRVEKAMEAMAPNLAQNLQGQCSECGAIVEVFFEPQQFILRELKDQAAFIYEDIHLLALYYQWSEAAILSLPRQRRMHYAEMIRQARRSA